MDAFNIRKMTPADRLEVAGLIYLSTNYWYQTHGRAAIFSGGPGVTAVYFDVYEALDPGCGVVAVHAESGRIIGSCFYHPRPTHVSLGIMNSHPSHAGSGVARALLRWILAFAEQRALPVRLVSSALNLDSYSLYTRAGFVPRRVYQDILVTVPQEGFKFDVPGRERVRPATRGDIVAMAELERELAGIEREKDLRYFVENRDGFWHVSVWADAAGKIEGFCASSAHPGCNMLGPGAARTAAQAGALLAAELDLQRGRSPVFLVPADCPELVQRVYAWGGRNCELHFSQVRGQCPPSRGVTWPTFLPETA